MVGTFLFFGVLIVVPVLIFWIVNRQNKVWTSDLSEIVTYLAERRRVFTQIHGHPAVFEPITLPKETLGKKPDITDIINTPEGIRLTVDKNASVREIQWSDDIPKNDVVQEIVKILYPRHLLQHLQFGLSGSIQITANGDSIVYRQKGIKTDQNYLEALFDLLVYLIETYPSLVALGSEVVEPLAKAEYVLSSIAPNLIWDIAHDTQKRIGSDPTKYICLHCLTHCTAYKVNLSPLQQVKYYGCRICCQSRHIVRWEKPIIAVLDNRVKQLKSKNGTIRENWITGRRMFDFKQVEIVWATDEEIERFAIQVGNDTYVMQKANQKAIRCVISSECKISENTVRILRNMFGQVEIVAPSRKVSLTQIQNSP